MKREIEEFKKLLVLGIKKVEKVLYEISGMDVSVKVVELLSKNFTDMIAENSFVLVQTISTEKSKNNIYFAMADFEFLKFLSALDKNADLLDEDYLIDSFLELGNIIVGNITSVLAYLLGKEVELHFPTLITLEKLKNYSPHDDFLSAVLNFSVKDIDVSGYLLFVIQLDILREMIEQGGV